MGDNCFGFQTGAASGPGGLPLNYGLFSQTGNSTPITNTLLEKTLIDSGVGTLTVPANGFKVGDSFEIEMGGHLTSANNNNITLKLKANSILLATSGLLNLPQTTNQHWRLNVVFTIRSIGAAGVASIQTSGQFTYTKDASNAFEGIDIVDLNNTTFDTTISTTLDVTATWASASASNIIYSETFVLNKIY
jgi:hypothetical protein